MKKIASTFVCLGIVILSMRFHGQAQAQTPQFGIPPEKGRTTGYWATVTKVVDPDTYWANGVKYREVGIDGPELEGYECDAEMRLAKIGTDRAIVLLKDRRVWIKPTGKWDRYGRPLVKTRIGMRQWYAETMLNDLLVVRWDGKQHDWCGPVRTD